MPSHRSGLGWLLVAVIALTGCASRLTGPDYAAEGPAWVAESVSPAATEIEVQHRILLIGDAGYYLDGDPTLAALGKWSAEVASSSVVYLGDNIYDSGLQDDEREEGERILAQQLEATAARKIVIPGNHDWGLLQRDVNAKSIRNQQAFVDEWPAGNAEFIPKNGCMGPVKRVLAPAAGDRKAVVFITVDPTPWINESLRAACPEPETHEGVLAQLDAMLAEHANDFVLVGSHYPMVTGGPHGGLSYGLLVDLIVTPLGWMMGGLMNTYEPEYADWIARTQEVFRRNPPAVFAAGHDHNLQLLDSGDVAGVYVVSGAGARERVSTVTNLPETLFAHAAPGFVVVDIGTRGGDHAVVLRVIEAGREAPVFEMALAASAPEAALETAPAFSTGNGEANWIVTEGATRSGATFSFPEVHIDGNGWLVMHPFKDGKPVGEVYVGATYLTSGDNRDVAITVDETPAPGTMFIVMLHRDVNENREFDFVFVDERNVLDKAVFEGSKMIAHPIAAPE